MRASGAVWVVLVLSVAALAAGAGPEAASQSSSSSPSSSASSGSSSSSSSRSGPASGPGAKPSASALAARQTPAGAGSLVGALGALVPGLVTNVAPLLLLVGLGTLIMPALGMGALGLLRESRRSANEPPAGPFVGGLPAGFAQFARPLQSSPQDVYYFTKRSLDQNGLTQQLREALERALHNLDTLG